ncbi:MAG: fimbrial assembly protein [Sideroxydans sp.]|nr:fimbrial assembly protein [Sideroxydans sp.]
MSQQINLFNPIFMKQKKYFSAVTMLQALGMIVVGAAVFYAYAAYQVNQLAAQSNETAKRYAAAQNRLTRYVSEYSPQKATQLLEEELRDLETRVAAQQSLIETLKSGAIGNTSGYSQYLRAFAKQVVPGLWLTGFNIEGDGAQISLSGDVLNPGLVPAYIQRLNQEKVMQGKSFAALQMQQPKGEKGNPAASSYVEFTLQSAEAGDVAK